MVKGQGSGVKGTRVKGSGVKGTRVKGSRVKGQGSRGDVCVCVCEEDKGLCKFVCERE